MIHLNKTEALKLIYSDRKVLLSFDEFKDFMKHYPVDEGDRHNGDDSSTRTSDGNATSGDYSATRTHLGDATSGDDSATRTYDGDAISGDNSATVTHYGDAISGEGSATRTEFGDATSGDQSATKTDEGNATSGDYSASLTYQGVATVGEYGICAGSKVSLGFNSVGVVWDINGYGIIKGIKKIVYNGEKPKMYKAKKSEINPIK